MAAKSLFGKANARGLPIGNLVMRLDAFARAAVRPVQDGAGQRIALATPRAAARVEGLRATLASYAGHLRHGAAFGDWDRAWRRHDPKPGSVFVITAYEVVGKPLAAYRRRMRKKGR